MSLGRPQMTAHRAAAGGGGDVGSSPVITKPNASRKAAPLQ